jgi:hypothetical protein
MQCLHAKIKNNGLKEENQNTGSNTKNEKHNKI